MSDKTKAKSEIARLAEQFDHEKPMIMAGGGGESVKEAHIEEKYIKPMFRALNWTDPDELLVQPSLRIDGNTKAPDYVLRLRDANGHWRKHLFMEAKHPKYNLEKDLRYIRQAYQYAYSTINKTDGSGNRVRLCLLTDFEEFRLFDCFNPEPLLRNELILFNKQIVRPFDIKYTDYEKEFDTLWDSFERANVAAGSLEKYRVTDEMLRKGRQSPDMKFLDNLREWRAALAVDMCEGDPDLPEAQLTAASQLVIDRVIFLKSLADRNIEEDYLSEILAKLDSAADSEVRLFDLCGDIFRKIDHTYNGELFNDKKHPELRGVAIKNRTMRKMLESLVPEKSLYNLAAMPPEIIGSAYEVFLGEVVVKTARGVAVEQKPEVKKAGGVYYTPRYIVDYIVENTVGRLLAGCETLEDAAKLKILDPACGSGSFLIGAYDALLDWHLERLIRDFKARLPKAKSLDKLKKEFEGRLKISSTSDAKDSHVFRLAPALKRKILLDNIYGVDIDPQAVEVTKFSLSLKAIENSTRGELYEDVTLFKQTVLPDLNGNIKCGNSLVASDFSLDPDELLRVKAFDWPVQFPAVMRQGGFHAVIGNPPYLNIDDTWGKGDLRLKAIKSSYPHVYNDKTDICFYFIAKAFDISRDAGIVSFITSRAFLEAFKADKLRGFLAGKSSVSKIIDFQNFYVFDGVGITTCVLQLDKKSSIETLDVFKLLLKSLPNNYLSMEILEDKQIFEHHTPLKSKLSNDVWTFASDAQSAINAKIDKIGIPLSNILHIGKGMETGCNNVFGKRSIEEMKAWGVPNDLYRFRASNSDIQRYDIRNRKEVLLYIEDVASFDDLPLGLRNHLLISESELKDRAAFKRGNCEWWRFTWPLHREFYSRHRIVCPYLAAENRFAWVQDNCFIGLTDTTVCFENNQPESLKYILGLLNSRLLTSRFRSIGKLKSGGIYEYFWNSISKLHIRRIDFSKPSEKALHDKLVGLVEKMLALTARIRDAGLESERETLRNAAAATDGQIDALVYELYGLTPEEIAVVEAGGAD